MNNEESIRYFAAHSLSYALSLPPRDGEAYLKGLLLVVGPRAEVDQLRQAHSEIFSLNRSMDQLQMTLTLR